MDKKNIRVIFNFTINNKDKRHNSNFNSKHYKNSNSKVSVSHYMCKRYCFMYEIDFNKLCI